MIWKYISIFLTGALVVLLAITVFLLKNVKPVINTDSYVASIQQSIDKLKIKGDGNTTPVSFDQNTQAVAPAKKKRFLLIFKRKESK
jgi:secreted protein with Ig-like and vWFA domain